MTPTALLSASSERNEFEQTSSASRSVRWASVPRTGRISCRTTGMPARATCQEASHPARPPPMTWMGRMRASSQSRRAASTDADRTKKEDARRGEDTGGRPKPPRLKRDGECLRRLGGAGRDERNVATPNADVVKLTIAELR